MIWNDDGGGKEKAGVQETGFMISVALLLYAGLGLALQTVTESSCP